jgi:hypothetical protein
LKFRLSINSVPRNMKTFAVLLCASALLGLAIAQNTCSLDNSSSLPTESSVSSGIEEDLANAQLDHYNMQLLAEVTNHGLKSLQDLFRKKHRRDEGGLEETIFSHDSDDLQSRELRMRQAELVCTSDETCFNYESELFCADPETGNFHDADGVVGNLISGEYTLPDGEKGNLTASINTSTTNSGNNEEEQEEADSDSSSSSTTISAASARTSISSATSSATGGTSPSALPSATRESASAAATEESKGIEAVPRVKVGVSDMLVIGGAFLGGMYLF